jgi:hypothetical protein
MSVQGLNEIRLQPSTDSGEADSLLPASNAVFPELDLWTNLAFENNDVDDGYPSPSKEKLADDDDEGSPTQEGHDSAVNPQSSLDLNEFLASLGIDSLLVPQLPQTQPTSPQPSLAQLLALHAASASAITPLAPPRTPPAPRNLLSDEAPQSSPAKRSRTAAEDKRRRNTAASARFRLKKKEREMALEKRAKELETRVGELEKECEGLRRENGWLKGLVVGVTGANAGAQVKVGGKRNREEAAADAKD